MTTTLTPAPLVRRFSATGGSAREWVAVVGAELGTTDRQFAGLILRAWLHMLRDRLTREAADRFAAKLPEDIRQIFTADWDRTAAPVKSGASEYTIRFARAVGIAVQEVPAAAAAVTAVLMRMLSPVEVYQALDELSPVLRVLLNPGVVLRAA